MQNLKNQKYSIVHSSNILHLLYYLELLEYFYIFAHFAFTLFIPILNKIFLYLLKINIYIIPNKNIDIKNN